MKAVSGAAAVAALLLSVLPTASAQGQVPGLDLSLAVDDLAVPIPYSGQATLSFNVTVGCLAGLRSMSETQSTTATATVDLADPPAWVTATPAAVVVTPSDPACATNGTGYITRSGTITLTVKPEAPGVVAHSLNFTATMPTQGDPMTASDDAAVKVAYHANYRLETDAKFPMTVTAHKTSFNLTVTQSSNARSMVMMEEVHASAGVIAGMASTVYESGGGKSDAKTFKITFTAPDGAWNRSTVSFKAYSHYLLLDSRAGPYDPGTAVTWEFVNGGVPVTKTNGGDSDKKSPMPVAPMTALGLVALAAMLRRR
jgi:hypothetical protein